MRHDGWTSSAQRLWWTLLVLVILAVGFPPIRVMHVPYVVWVPQDVYANVGEHDCPRLVANLAREIHVHLLA